MKEGKGKNSMIFGPLEIWVKSSNGSERGKEVVANSNTKKTTRAVPMQLSIHRSPSRHFTKEIASVFPSLGIECDKILIIPTFQKSENELLIVNPIVNEERDRLLDNVLIHLPFALYFNI